MIKLPKGYYAIMPGTEGTVNEFSFKGVSYEVESGVSLFSTVTEALASIGGDLPESTLEGLDGED